MKIIESGNLVQAPKNAVVTSGTFDGVHIGHQKILKRITNLAKATNGESIVLTFWPHPRFILQPNDHSLKLLSTLEEKAHLLAKAGIDYLIKIPFTEEFSKLTSEEFIKNILIDKLSTKILVIGYDHRFGRNREGSFDFLKANEKAFGFAIEEIPKQEIDDMGVSSTKIREALLGMEVTAANSYLGRPYSLSGTVVEGEKIGRSIGFPTANIAVEEKYKLIPRDGVYAVNVMFEHKKYHGMLNIGMRPTVNGLIACF